MNNINELDMMYNKCKITLKLSLFSIYFVSYLFFYKKNYIYHEDALLKMKMIKIRLVSIYFYKFDIYRFLFVRFGLQ